MSVGPQFVFDPLLPASADLLSGGEPPAAGKVHRLMVLGVGILPFLFMVVF